MPRFGERLRTLRTSKGLSQLEFSKQIKLSKSSVNMYERGEREPGLETLERIADYFNVDMDYLLGKSDIVNKCQWETPAPSTVAVFALDSDEKQMILKFRCLDDRGKAAVLNVLNHEYDSLPGEKAHPLTKEA